MRICRECKMSLVALEVTGVKHNPQTGICNDCEVPWAEAELISYTEEQEGITIEVDLSGYGGNQVDTPGSNPGALRKRESSNLSTRTKSLAQICLEYTHAA